MLLYNLDNHVSRVGDEMAATDLPPELFHAVERHDPLDILHPALGSETSRCLRDGCLRESRHRGLGEIATLGCWRVEPERPGGIQGMLRDTEINKTDRIATSQWAIETGSRVCLP